MVCGRSYHGGDQQPGCGLEFDWATAQKYEVRLEQTQQVPVAKPSRLRGRNAFHPLTGCCLCGSECIAGPRFRCIHCPNFDVCSVCEPKLVDWHPADHVFEILFESDFRCPWLPRGTRITIVRSGNRLPQSLTRRSSEGVELEGQVGKVIARRRPPLEGYIVELDLGQGTVELQIEHLEPIIASRAEAEGLLNKTLEEDGETEPAPSRQQLSESDSDTEIPFGRHGPPRLRNLHPHVAPQPVYDFADDSPLSDEEMQSRALRHMERERRVRPRRQARHTEGGYRLGSAHPMHAATTANSGQQNRRRAASRPLLDDLRGSS